MQSILHPPEILTERIVTAEQDLRDNEQGRYRRLLAARQEAADRRYQRVIRAAQTTRERISQREEGRVAMLLAQAEALRQANEIRAYVEAVVSATTVNIAVTADSQVEEWRCWALREADRIDPIVSGQIRVTR